jgi:hypothetical protein
MWINYNKLDAGYYYQQTDSNGRVYYVNAQTGRVKEALSPYDVEIDSYDDYE